MWHPIQKDGAYLDSIGQLFISRYGPDACDIGLLIPNLDPGVCKYRARESLLAETIITIVCAIERTAVAYVQVLHDDGVDPSRTNVEALWMYLEQLRDTIEQELKRSGLCKALEDAKAAYREETAQFDFFLEHVLTLVKAGFAKQAFFLVPFHFRSVEELRSEEFKAWFIALLSDIRISCSARVWGNTEEANENTLRVHAAFASNSVAHRKGGQATGRKATLSAAERRELFAVPMSALRVILREIGDIITKPPPRRKKTPGVLSSHDTWRWCFCLACGSFIVAEDENVQHSCPNEPLKRVQDANFPNLRRITYPHHILADPDLAPLVPQFLDLVTPIQVQDVFSVPANQALARTLFPSLDLSGLQGTIWADRNCADSQKDGQLHVAMALDLAASSLSQCPPEIWPVTAADRAKAWVKDCSPWLKGKRHVMRCAFDHFALMTRRNTTGQIDHSCPGKLLDRPFDPDTGRRAMGTRERGGPRDCGTQQSHAVTTIYDLPPEYIQRVVYTALIAPLQAAPKAPRARNNKKK
ncbi:hypothetical protein B0H13DRAFT_2535311 [Mycena leptocephala]|nr:hypothetical protein B0H13DRAFT_2535311 [Mycena leptocephala]